MTQIVPTVQDYRFNAEVVLAVINCGKCGGSYAISERYRAKCQEAGTGWTCPYCETGWGYFKNGETGPRPSHAALLAEAAGQWLGRKVQVQGPSGVEVHRAPTRHLGGGPAVGSAETSAHQAGAL